MSFPNIPNVVPKVNLKRSDAINLLLASIAFEELGLAHMNNAEAEKIQKVLKTNCSFEELIALNKNVDKTLQTMIVKEMLLQFKLNSVLEIPYKPDYDCDEDKLDYEEVFDEKLAFENLFDAKNNEDKNE